MYINPATRKIGYTKEDLHPVRFSVTISCILQAKNSFLRQVYINPATRKIGYTKEDLSAIGTVLPCSILCDNFVYYYSRRNTASFARPAMAGNSTRSTGQTCGSPTFRTCWAGTGFDSAENWAWRSRTSTLSSQSIRITSVSRPWSCSGQTQREKDF